MILRQALEKGLAVFLAGRDRRDGPAAGRGGECVGKRTAQRGRCFYVVV